MIKTIIHMISNTLLIALCFFNIFTMVFNHGLAGAGPQPPDVVPGGLPIPLIAIPEDFFFRVVQPPEVLSLYEATATFSTNYISDGKNYFGDTCTTWPAQAQNAFNYAVGVWATHLQSSVPITINACWATNLPQGVLGHSGSRNFMRDFSGAPEANTWYPVSLANALHGMDLNPGVPDIEIAYSSTFNWYFGTDGNPGSGQYDFVTVVMHEITHGLGFSGSMAVISGQGRWGIGSSPIAYDRFTENGNGQDLINTSFFPNPSADLATQLTSNNLYFNGTNANAANGGSRPKIYAPNTWSSGSSYSHLDFSTYNGTENALMVYAIGSGTAIHDPGPITMGILQDIGWNTSSPEPQPSPDVTANNSNGPITVSRNNPLLITVKLNAGNRSGENADCWVVAMTPFDWYHYDLPSDSWLPGLLVTYQGPLFDLSSFQVLNQSGLPTGPYIFYFGVDMNMNGSLDMNEAYYDSVEVNIVP